MRTLITKPTQDEYAPYYQTYISKIDSEYLMDILEKSRDATLAFLTTMPAEKWDYRYQEDKWTIKEVLVHLMDVERIFTYRALRFSRNDRTSVAGFDENEYIPESNTSERTVESILAEYVALRQSTIQFFKNINSEMSLRTGIANGKEISVRALGFIIPGHEMHHINVIRERYF